MSDTGVKILPYSIDLDEPIGKTPLPTLFATEDKEAHRFELTLHRSGTELDLTGAKVTGYFVRYSDRRTEKITTGTASGSKVMLTLNQYCYTLPGKFTLAIKIESGSVTATVFFGEGGMTRSKTDSIADDTRIILGIDDILGHIDAMERATTKATNAASAANTAAGNANTATTSANNSTTNANNAAAAANTAAAAANAAAKALGDETAADSEKLGGKAAGDYLLKTETAADSEKLGGKAAAHYIQPLNLLDGSDFSNPINQRGQATYTTGGAYTIDRWDISANMASLAVASGCVVLTAKSGLTGYIRQYLPWAGLLGKTVTLAACLEDGTVICTSGTMPSAAPSADTTVSGGASGDIGVYISAMPGKAAFQIGVHNGGTARIKWAALYLGTYTADTLPEYTPKGYAAELAACRRYYQRIGEGGFAATFGFGIIQASADKYVRICVPLPQTLRANPAPTLTGTLTIMGFSPSGSLTTTVESIVSAYATKTGAEIVMVSAAAIVANSMYIARMNSGSYLELSADL